MTELEIWRAAQQFIDWYGEDASIKAALKADLFLEQGNPDGVKVWTAIMRAITELQRTTPNDSSKVN